LRRRTIFHQSNDNGPSQVVKMKESNSNVIRKRLNKIKRGVKQIHCSEERQLKH